MLAPLKLLLCWLSLCFLCCPASGSRSLDSASAAGTAASSGHLSRGDPDEDQENDEDNEEDNAEEGDNESNGDKVDAEMDEAEKRFEKNEDALEDAEAVGLKEDLEEEESESAYAREKTASGDNQAGSEEPGKARIRRLMDELVAASIELREINRALDEL
ncbi:DNA-directed RNA polymerase I subunit RPA1 [Babesia caballi]|uniref:DNA-directed RNA polymerase I subunit RPA1 n=1 Tax=Babesia caballi TaxID=5871 RepID=A0AAV4M2Z1_BABCB|nr:DNA-directed RNA polymerase I subunit RPA1 [Babesia caballi]